MSKVSSIVSPGAEGQALLRQVIDYYHQTLKASPEALSYLKDRGLDHPEVIDRFRLGYANRTLGLSLPIKQVKAGADVRARLVDAGLYRDTGHEHFNGSLVVPVMGEDGTILQIYGRKLLDNLRKGTPLHLYLPGDLRGVWNSDAFKESKEIILAKSLMDALTFWCAGFRNVTAAFGVEGFTSDHLEAFRRHGTERVLIGFDSDEPGNRAADEVACKFAGLGIECLRLRFPEGMDANSVARGGKPAARSLGLVIRSAEPMGGHLTNRPASHPVSQVPAQAPAQVPAHVPAQAPTRVPTIAPTIACAIAPDPAPPHEIQGHDLILVMEDRQYRVRGWQKPLNPESLKVNLMVSREDWFHVDTLDLYQAKARTAFVRQAGVELGVGDDALKTDLGKVLRKVEALQADQLAEALKIKDPRPSMSPEDQSTALELLRAPDLMDRILRDFSSLGVVGEESNTLTGYLAAVSRLLDRPLALLIQSASAAGKSSLMDAVLELVPEEDLVRYSAMTGQSLFYMGERSLRHKVLAVAEEEGAKNASYALKLLQSEGRVTMASTGKNPNTGMLVTHDYTVEGPVMLFLTTTAIDLEEELLNRCLVLTVNESREQTRAIHAVQRSRETLEGILAKTRRDALVKLHRNAQRLLEPLAVVNPYAGQLSFRDHQTRSRRDHVKYLTLIRSIALLHQHQREVKTLTHQGEPLRYIEVIPADIRMANRLAQEVLGRTVDELLPQTRKLLGLLHEWMKDQTLASGVSQAEFRFTRRQVRDTLGWGDTQLKVHLGRLVELEFLVAHRGRTGKTFLYELLYQGEDAEGRVKLLGLIEDGPSDAGVAEAGRGSVGLQSGGGRGMVGTLEPAPAQAMAPISVTGSAVEPQGVSESTTSRPTQGVR